MTAIDGLSRRRFAALGGAAVAAAAAPALTARQVVERIQKKLAEEGIAWRATTVDTFKAGNPDTPVTGIATTFMATLDQLQRAAARGRNFVITHEPTFWSHLDRTEELGNDPVYRFKTDFIAKNKLVVWRFHDHLHARKPDPIFVGFNRRMGWEKHLAEGSLGKYDLPETTLGALAGEVRRKLRTRSLRAIGDPQMQVRRAATGMHGLAQNVQALRTTDVILIPEAREWDSAEYVRDLAESGQKKGALVMAHEEFEEWGMEDCAEWLRSFVGEAPVEWIPAGEPFWMV